MLVSDATRAQGMAMAIPTGLLLAASLLALVGFVNWLVARCRKHPKSFWRASLSVPMMCVALSLSFVSEVGSNTRATREADDKAASAVGGHDELLRQRADFAEWFEFSKAASDPYFSAIEGHLRFLNYLGSPKVGNKTVLAMATDVRRDFVAYRTEVQRLPSPAAAYAKANADYRRAAQLWVRSYDLYLEGFNTPSGDKKGDAAISNGDKAYGRGVTLYSRAAPPLDAVFQKLGGRAFGDTIGYGPYIEKIIRQKAEMKRLSKG